MKRWVYRRPADIVGRRRFLAPPAPVVPPFPPPFAKRRYSPSLWHLPADLTAQQKRRVFFLPQTGQPQPPVPFPKKRAKHAWLWPDREISEVFYWRRHKFTLGGQPQPSVPFPLRRPKWIWGQAEFPYWAALRRPHFVQGVAAPAAQFFPPFKKRDAQVWRYQAESLVYAKRRPLPYGGEKQPPEPFPKKRQKHQWVWPDVQYPESFFWRRKKFTPGGEPQPPVPFPYNKRKNRWVWPGTEYSESLYYKRRHLTEGAQVAAPVFLFKQRRPWPQPDAPVSPALLQRRRVSPQGGPENPPRPFPFRRKGWVWWEREYPFASYHARRAQITEGIAPAAPTFFPPFKRRPIGQWIFQQKWTLIQKRPKFPLTTPAAPPVQLPKPRPVLPAQAWDEDFVWPARRPKLIPKSPDFFFRPAGKRRLDGVFWAAEFPWQTCKRRPKRLPQTPPSPTFPPFRRRDAIEAAALWAPKPEHPAEQYLRRRRFTPGSPIIAPVIFGATGVGVLDAAAGAGSLDAGQGTGLLDGSRGQSDFDKSEGAGGLDAAKGEGNLN